MEKKATTVSKKTPNFEKFLAKHSFELRGVASVLKLLLEMAPVPAATKENAVSVVENLYKAADSIALVAGIDIDGDGRPGLHPHVTSAMPAPKQPEE